jgi:hypothetical protein
VIVLVRVLFLFLLLVVFGFPVLDLGKRERSEEIEIAQNKDT